jgi:hypothetical protein
VYSNSKTYLLWGGVIFPVVIVLMCLAVYGAQRSKIGVRAEHAAVSAA